MYLSLLILLQPNKKQKTEDSAVQLDDSWNIENPFEKGSIHDEVELKFGSGQSLFVSRAFLMYSSPVFDRMFRADFLENNTNTVELPGKDFEIFHNMLLHMHPGRRKTIPGKAKLEIPYLSGYNSGVSRLQNDYK